MASLAPDDGDPLYKTDEALSSLLDFVSDVIIQLSEAADQNTQILTFSNNTGGDLLDNLKEGRDQLGKADIRYLGNPSLDKSLSSFIEEATQLDQLFNGNKLKHSLRMMNHVRDALFFYLSQSWNSDLEQPETDDSKSQSMSRTDVDSQSPDQQKSKVLKKKVLKKVTPKKSEQTWTCRNHCQKVFTNAESFNKHQNENNLKEKVQIPKVSCMLLKKGTEKRCSSKQTLSLMYRHLENCHGIKRPGSDQHLRYFESENGGQTFTGVVFLPLNAPDPDPSTYIDFDNMGSVKTATKKGSKVVTRKKDNVKASANPNSEDSLEDVRKSRILKRRRLDFDDSSDSSNSNEIVNVDNTAVQCSLESSLEFSHGEANSVDIDASMDSNNTKEAETQETESQEKEDSNPFVDRKEMSDESSISKKDFESSFESPKVDDSITKNEMESLEKKDSTVDNCSNVESELEKKKSSSDEESESSLQSRKDDSNKRETEESNPPDDECLNVEPEPQKMPVDNSSSDEDYMETESEAEDTSETPKRKQVGLKVSSTSPEVIKDLGIPLLVDSDQEEDDLLEFTEIRIKNKKQRYVERNVEESEQIKLEDLPGNSEFIKKFENFLKDVKFSSNSNKDTSTIDTYMKHLFSHPHSFLSYMVAQDPSFRLDRLLMFTNTDLFLEIKSPMDWQLSEGGESGILNASKRRTMLKCHAAIRDFVEEDLQSTNFGTDLPSLLRREKLLQNFRNIEKGLSRRRVWAELDRLVKEEKSERDNLKEGLNPSNNYNETVAVKRWFASEKFKTLYKKQIDVWEKAVENDAISKTDFVEFANFSKFILVLQDKNRSGCYNYTNTQFLCGQKIWFPKDGEASDGWDQHKPRDRPHDAWQMKISGTKAGQKFGRTVTVTVEGYSKDLMEKFRDLKVIHFGEEQDDNSAFFCNYEGNPLSVLKDTRGSLWSVFKETCEIDEATVTMIRRALENKAQEDQASAKRINIINNHSEDVGLHHYDRSAPDYRSGYLHKVSQEEGSNVIENKKEELPDKLITRRLRMEERDRAAKSKVTEDKLSGATKSRYTLGRNMKIFPEDKKFIQNLLSEEKYRHLHPITYEDVFPAPKLFKKIFYRLVDSNDLEQEDSDKLRQIEKLTFKIVKEEVAKKFEGGWDGGLEVNKEADKVIATKVRNSLRIYEQTKKKYQPTFFFFK